MASKRQDKTSPSLIIYSMPIVEDENSPFFDCASRTKHEAIYFHYVLFHVFSLRFENALLL